ncbi:MAG: ABC transporter permease [Halanaerobiales bacterium]|nr:ABC transporter permease [Halanaerobiales bacterium]
MKLFKELFIANLKELIRDKSGMFWLIAFPIIFVFIFGLIFTNSGNEQLYNIGFVSEGDTVFNKSIEESIANISVFKINKGKKQVELKALQEGNRDLVLIIPEINRNLNEQFEIEILTSDQRAQASTVLISSLKEIFYNIERQITNQKEVFKIKTSTVSTDTLSDFDYILPGILAMAIMQLGLFGSFNFLNLREKGIIRGLGVTPLPRQIILSSEITMRIVISIIQTVLIIFLGRWFFNVHIVSSLLVVFGVVVIGAFTFISLGYMLITFADSMESGRGIVQIVQFPMLFLSGIFFPIDFMPKYIRPIVKVLPLTYLGNALREVMVGIPSQVTMTRNITILVIWSVLTVLITVKFWKWE